MRYFYDTEFYEDGKQIHWLSFGMVSEDGRNLYMEREYFDWSMVPDDHFVQTYVRPWLGHSESCLVWPHDAGQYVREFMTENGDMDNELWGYYSAYDHVVLAQLFGRMAAMPGGIPWFTNDLKQEAVRLDFDTSSVPQDGVEHHALADAMWNKKLYYAMKEFDETRLG